jgi:hypothetical protein
MEAVGVFLWEFLQGTWSLLWKMFVIIVPIMILLELIEGTNAFRRVAHVWARLLRPLGLSDETATPTLIGFLFGLAYGSGVIVRDARRGTIGRRQIFLMSLFLSMVHAIVEDSLVFVAIGASAIWVFGFRMLWAGLVTLVIGAAATAYVRRRRVRRQGPPEGGRDG